MNSVPLPPNESKLTPGQRVALKSILKLVNTHFRRGLITVIYTGTDDKLHVQVVTNANNSAEALDLGRRTMQQLEISEKGVITTLAPNEKRIIAP